MTDDWADEYGPAPKVCWWCGEEAATTLDGLCEDCATEEDTHR